jgi:hypothetical protein
MARKFGAVAAGLIVIALCLAGSAADEKGPTVKDVMKTVGGKEGLCAKCNAAAKVEKWEDAQKLAKQLNDCGVALTKTQCPKGNADEWKKLTKRYCEQTVAVKKAADDKDAKAFGAAIKTFTGSCKGCHDNYKQ